MYAHSKGNDKRHWETIDGHHRRTAALAARFGRQVGAPETCRLLASGHDIGKWSARFQRLLDGLVEHAEHKSAFANLLARRGVDWGVVRVCGYIVGGHHGGLPDFVDAEGSGHACLKELLDRPVPQEAVEKFRSFDHRRLLRAVVAETPDAPATPLSMTFWMRMVHSCLVDADFLATEAFHGDRPRRGFDSPQALWGRFGDQVRRRFFDRPLPGTVNAIRRDVFRRCEEAAGDDRHSVFSLSVPTGGAKTLAGAAFALKRCAELGASRVIYVAPHTSILDQHAKTFRAILGENVVEHHSNVTREWWRVPERSRLACENWDAPFVLTTNVQFFESLFASRTGRCRKLHNIANSVVVLDEAQALPARLAQPALHALRELAGQYGATFLFSTATQPPFFGRTQGHDDRVVLDGLPRRREIVPQTRALHEKMKRNALRVLSRRPLPAWSALVDDVLARDCSTMAVVNTRREAIELHRSLLAAGVDATHLSKTMCGAHCLETIEDVKRRLADGDGVKVVATNLVEAGVDFSFARVYRAVCGLDSLAQAAGRCNREGKLAAGEVVLFVPPNGAPPFLRADASLTMDLAARADDLLGPQAVAEFHRRKYANQESCDQDRVIPCLESASAEYFFRTAAARFRLVDDRSRTVLVPHGKGREIIARAKADGWDWKLQREAQPYTVGIFERQLRDAVAAGLPVEFGEDVAVCHEYDPVCGVVYWPDLRAPGADTAWATGPQLPAPNGPCAIPACGEAGSGRRGQ